MSVLGFDDEGFHYWNTLEAYFDLNKIYDLAMTGGICTTIPQTWDLFIKVWCLDKAIIDWLIDKIKCYDFDSLYTFKLNEIALDLGENHKNVFFACIFAGLYGIRSDSTTLQEVDYTFSPWYLCV